MRSRLLSLCGTREKLFIARCPLLSKNSRNILLSSFTPYFFTLLLPPYYHCLLYRTGNSWILPDRPLCAVCIFLVSELLATDNSRVCECCKNNGFYGISNQTCCDCCDNNFLLMFRNKINSSLYLTIGKDNYQDLNRQEHMVPACFHGLRIANRQHANPAFSHLFLFPVQNGFVALCKFIDPLPCDVPQGTDIFQFFQCTAILSF